MAKKGDVLSPHHLGEMLGAALLQAIHPNHLGALPVLDPGDGKTKKLSDVLPSVLLGLLGVQAATRLDPVDGRTFDGMHAIDCALVFEKLLVGIELKLGTTRMSPGDFRRRFVTDEERKKNIPRLRGSLVDGSMVALLDWNGRAAGPLQPPLLLRAMGKAVQQHWLLMVLEETMLAWRNCSQLASTLGTGQLAGVFSLESVARALGRDEAKRVAKLIACEEIDRWPL